MVVLLKIKHKCKEGLIKERCLAEILWNFLVYQIYQLLPFLTKLFILVCLLYLAYIAIKHKNLKKIIRSGVFFLFITATISPGLIVNEVFKSNLDLLI